MHTATMNHSYSVIVIAGGASGAGLTTARRLLTETNTRIALLDPDINAGALALGSLGTQRAMFIPTDPCNAASVRLALQAVLTRFGAIHVCIHFADQLRADATVDHTCDNRRDETAQRSAQTNQISAFNLLSGCTASMMGNAATSHAAAGLMVFVMHDATSRCMLPSHTFEAQGIAVETLFSPAAIATIAEVQVEIANTCAMLLERHRGHTLSISADLH